MLMNSGDSMNFDPNDCHVANNHNHVLKILFFQNKAFIYLPVRIPPMGNI